MPMQPAHSETWNINQFEIYMRENWLQGEHVSIVGPTGCGKTTLTAILGMIRGYTVLIAVKAYDDTLNIFKKNKFKVIKKWPPDFNEHHVILWAKAETLDGLSKQAITIKDALEKIYISGGWCVIFDEAGYIAGHLKLGTHMGIMLNQGRSSHISIIAVMTRPHSMIARVPPESLNQSRHIIVFRYTDEREIKAVSEIAGISLKNMVYLQQQLNKHDFIYIGKDRIIIVKQGK